MIKKIGLVSLIAFLASFTALTRAHATQITVGPTLAGTGNINFETNGTPNGTTVQFALDGPGQVSAIFYQISPVDGTPTQVSQIIQNYSAGGAQTLFWNGLWQIGTVLGRHDGTFTYQLTPSTTSTSGPALPAPLGSTTFTINSVDIHNLTVISSFDSNGNTTFPFAFAYLLAKPALVTAQITNSTGTLVATLLNAQLQAGETTSSATVSWNGLSNSGNQVPLGTYNLTLNAADPNTTDRAYTRTASFVVTSLAGAAGDPQTLFRNSVFVYPNPVRNGQGIFQYQAVRPGANISLKIYTISGTLVLDQQFPNVPVGVIEQYTWKAVNQSGNRVGRGLYYYVMREDDSQGSLQTIKKMAVLP